MRHYINERKYSGLVFVFLLLCTLSVFTQDLPTPPKLDFKPTFKLDELSLPKNTIDKLRELNITSSKDIFKNLLKTKMHLTAGNNGQMWDKVKQNLLTASITKNQTLLKALQNDKKYSSLDGIAKLSPEKIVELSGNEFSLEEAKIFAKKARATEQLSRTYALQQSVMNYNSGLYDMQPDSPLENSPGKPDIRVCYDCNEHNNLLSPAVYAIDLLEMISQVFQEFKTADTLNYAAVGPINGRLYQRLEEVITVEDIDITASYVIYANEILENYLGDPAIFEPIKTWPNAIQDPQKRIEAKSKLYQFFRSRDVSYPDVIPELFEAYINEFGTSRTDLDIVKLGSNDFKENYARPLKLVLADLDAMDKDPETLTFVDVNRLKERLRLFYERKMERVLRLELSADLAEEYGRKFEAFYASIRAEIEESLFSQRLNSLAPSDQNLSMLLQRIRGEIRNCTSRGNNCPQGVTSINGYTLPLYKIQMLYQNFAKHYPGHVNFPNNQGGIDSVGFARHTFGALKDTLLAREFARRSQLLGTNGDSLLNATDSIEVAAIIEKELRSPLFFDAQLDSLSKLILAHELTNWAEFRAAFNAEKTERANELWRDAVKKVEAGFHSQIRENLIDLIIAEEPYLRFLTGTKKNRAAAIELLGNFLFLDLTQIEDIETTPIAFTISRLQEMIQAADFGNAQKTLKKSEDHQPEIYHTELIDADPWKTRWEWMQSYATWHAAMMVALYPENYLNPRLRTRTSDHFRLYITERINNINANSNNVSAMEDFLGEVQKLNEMTPLGVFSHNGQLFFLAAHNYNEINYSILKPDGHWQSWQAEPIILSSAAFSDTDNVTDDKIKIVRKGNNLFLCTVRFGNNKLTAYVAKLSFTDDGLSKQGGWKTASDLSTFTLPGQTYSQAPYYRPLDYNNLYFFTPGRIDDDNTIAFGYVDPKDAKGRLILHHTKVPSVFYRHYNHSAVPENSIVNFLGNDYIRQRGINYEDVVCVLTEPTSDKVIWIKGNLADEHYAIPGDFFSYPFKDNGFGRFVYNSATTMRYLPGPGSNRGIYKPVTNQIYKFGSNNSLQKLNVPADLEIFSMIEWNEGFVFYCRSRESGAHFYTFSDNLVPDGNRYYLTEPNVSRITVDPGHNVAEDKIVSWPASIYNDEALLHLPFYMAHISKTANDDEAATEWLNRIIDYKNLDNYNIHPLLHDSRVNISDITNLANSPYDPYAHAEVRRTIYWAWVKMWHAENLIDRADHLFQLDSPESVNRAREYYELALKVLKLGGEMPDDPCALAWKNFVFAVNDYLDIPSTLTTTPGSDYISAIDKDSKIHEVFNSSYSHISKGFLVNNHLGSVMDPSVSNDDAKFTTTMNQKRRYSYAAEYDISELKAINDLQEATDTRESISASEIPTAMFVWGSLEKGFCMPRNPKFKILFWRIQSNLDKIRTSRNFAGFQRQLPPYALPITPDRIINNRRGDGSIKLDELIGANRIPLFRYPFLIERARSLARQAEQFEGTLLNVVSAAEAKLDDIEYNRRRAFQDLQLQEANMSLKKLHISEAINHQRQALAQTNRTSIQINHYNDLIEEGMIGWEHRSLQGQYAAAALHVAGGIFGAIEKMAGAAKGKIAGAFSSGSSSAAASSSAFASAFQQKASYVRREQDWRFQRKLSKADRKIARIGQDIALDRLAIVQREEAIASLQVNFARDQIEYFQKQTESKRAIFEWMHKHLKSFYKEQLGMAVGAARTAQKALEFQRQNNLDFIGVDYLKYQDTNRYLGAKKLITDIDALDDYRIQTTNRRKEIQKSISLSSVAPTAFQTFQQTGVLPFETPMEWFDRDFPGHYMRLIRDIEVNVIGLIPPVEGIRATVYNDGFSRIHIDPADDEAFLIYKFPESISISGGNGGNGLFTLRPDDPLLYPFEGNGVASRWVFEMPRGANPIDYDAIADIIFTIRYTAIEDRGFRQKVLRNMDLDEDGYVKVNGRQYFSFRRDFPDEWYYFHNPVCGRPQSDYINPLNTGQADDQKPMLPYTMVVDLDERYFPYNEEKRKISSVTLSVKLKNELQQSSNDSGIVQLNLKFYPESRATLPVQLFNITDLFKSTQELNGISPYGKWVIQLNQLESNLRNCNIPTTGIQPEDIEDIILVIDYEAKVHYNQ